MANSDEAETSGEVPDLLTVPEVAALMRVSKATVRRLMAAGDLPHIRVAEGSIRVAGADLAQFIEDRRRPSCARPAAGSRPDA